MALALQPEIIIMDEPTTALDVVVQREILDEIERLREGLGFSVIFITHDLSLLLEISDRLAVMYAAEVIEQAPAELVAAAPAHPYTLGLLRSFPDLRSVRRALRGIPGTPPDLRNDFPGCPFAPRCEFRFEPCRTAHPVLRQPAARTAAAAQAAAQAAHAAQAGAAADPPASDWRVACHQHDPRYQPGGPLAGLNGLPAADVMRTETQVGADSGGGDT